MENKISLKYPPDLNYSSILNSLTKELGAIWNLSQKLIDKIESCLIEASNNSIQNFKEGTNGFVSLEIEKIDSLISIQIVNPGDEIEKNKFHAPDLNEHREGGYGLFIIKSLSDSFVCSNENGLNIIKMNFKLK